MLSFWMKYLVDPNYDQRSALRSPLVMAGVCAGAHRSAGRKGRKATQALERLRAENGMDFAAECLGPLRSALQSLNATAPPAGGPVPSTPLSVAAALCCALRCAYLSHTLC